MVTIILHVIGEACGEPGVPCPLQYDLLTAHIISSILRIPIHVTPAIPAHTPDELHRYVFLCVYYCVCVCCCVRACVRARVRACVRAFVRARACVTTACVTGCMCACVRVCAYACVFCVTMCVLVSAAYYNTNGNTTGAGYDGPGECVSHVFGNGKRLYPAVGDVTAFWMRVNNSEYINENNYAQGYTEGAWLFVPPRCNRGGCKLIVLPGGCRAYTDSPPSGGSDDDFARYGMANGFVVLKPCQTGPIDLSTYPNNHENYRGMVDVSLCETAKRGGGGRRWGGRRPRVALATVATIPRAAGKAHLQLFGLVTPPADSVRRSMGSSRRSMQHKRAARWSQPEK